MASFVALDAWVRDLGIIVGAMAALAAFIVAVPLCVKVIFKMLKGFVTFADAAPLLSQMPERLDTVETNLNKVQSRLTTLDIGQQDLNMRIDAHMNHEEARLDDILHVKALLEDHLEWSAEIVKKLNLEADSPEDDV